MTDNMDKTLVDTMQQNPLALPGTITKTSLILPANLSFDDWEDLGKRLSGARESLKWWLGSSKNRPKQGGWINDRQKIIIG